MVKAQSAQAFRIKYDGKEDRSVAPGPELWPEQLEELQKLLEDARSYAPELGPKKCAPKPGIFIRFTPVSGGQADLEICLECDEASLHPTTSAAGKGPWENIDPIHNQLVILAKELFTRDDDIQSLEND